MSELFKCRRCRKVLIGEEFDGHKCRPKTNGKLVRIDVDFWFPAKHPQTGEDIMSGTGLDGTTYWFIKRSVRQSDKIAFNPSDEMLRGPRTDGDVTEPASRCCNTIG